MWEKTRETRNDKKIMEIRDENVSEEAICIVKTSSLRICMVSIIDLYDSLTYLDGDEMET